MKRLLLASTSLLGSLTCWSVAGEPVDRSVKLGPFTAEMSFEEIEVTAGLKGKRWCRTWPPNPTIHYCELTIDAKDYHLKVSKSADGQTLSMDRRVPVPDDMPLEQAMKQVVEKFRRFGPPISVGQGYNWGCPSGECGQGVMIRAFVSDGIANVVDGRRHLSVAWRDWDASDANQKRFQKESGDWAHSEEQFISYPKLDL